MNEAARSAEREARAAAVDGVSPGSALVVDRVLSIDDALLSMSRPVRPERYTVHSGSPSISLGTSGSFVHVDSPAHIPETMVTPP